MKSKSLFDDAIDLVESLPEEQRESLITIVKQRLIEERRDNLALRIKEAKEEYARGEIRKGDVDIFLIEIGTHDEVY